jgi:hypothetical protein
MCVPCCFTISTAEVGVIESWGKFNRLAQPGLGFVICPMEQLVGRLSFRVQQLDVRVETKTLDNVFLTAVVSVQVRKRMKANERTKANVCVMHRNLKQRRTERFFLLLSKISVWKHTLFPSLVLVLVFFCLPQLTQPFSFGILLCLSGNPLD